MTPISADVAGEPNRPRLRGRLHQVASFVAIPAGLLLILVAHNTTARIAALVYALSLVGQYAISGAYHRLDWTPKGRRRIKRADHSMIYILIAGTATPVALLALQKPWSIVMLAVVWTGAAIGVGMKMTRIEGFRIATAVLYIALGWVVVLLAPQLAHGLSLAALCLVAAGGLLYTSGSIVLLRHRPDPSPAVFGYHEIWHSMVVAASACHYAAVLLILLPLRAAVG
jgi:hemolysin III